MKLSYSLLHWAVDDIGRPSLNHILTMTAEDLELAQSVG